MGVQTDGTNGQTDKHTELITIHCDHYVAVAKN